MPHNDGITEYQHHVLWIVILLLSCRMQLRSRATTRVFNFFKVGKRTQLKDPVPSLAIHKATGGNIGPGHSWK